MIHPYNNVSVCLPTQTHRHRFIVLTQYHPRGVRASGVLVRVVGAEVRWVARAYKEQVASNPMPETVRKGYRVLADDSAPLTERQQASQIFCDDCS